MKKPSVAKLKLKTEQVRVLTSEQLDKVVGGGLPDPMSGKPSCVRD